MDSSLFITIRMMGYLYGYGSNGFGLFGSLVCLIMLVDLVLLGIWLWKQISKK